jgi:hypothetical protein
VPMAEMERAIMDLDTLLDKLIGNLVVRFRAMERDSLV